MTRDITKIVDVTTEWNFVQTFSTPTTAKTRSIPNITPTKITKTIVVLIQILKLQRLLPPTLHLKVTLQSQLKLLSLL